MTYNSLIGEIRKLPPRRRLAIIDEIYNSIADDDALRLTRAQKAELRRRIREHEKDPATAIPLEEVLAEMSPRKR
jgi:putative addiction module component (TIGR02574 family)